VLVLTSNGHNRILGFPLDPYILLIKRLSHAVPLAPKVLVLVASGTRLPVIVTYPCLKFATYVPVVARIVSQVPEVAEVYTCISTSPENNLILSGPEPAAASLP